MPSLPLSGLIVGRHPTIQWQYNYHKLFYPSLTHAMRNTTTHPPSAKDGESASPITHEKLSSVPEDELLQRIEMSPYARDAKKAFKRDRSSIIDTGGQPQFHEVLPIFMRGTSATMFAIRLDESLSDHPLIEYFDDNGQRVVTRSQ